MVYYDQLNSQRLIYINNKVNSLALNTNNLSEIAKFNYAQFKEQDKKLEMQTTQLEKYDLLFNNTVI